MKDGTYNVTFSVDLRDCENEEEAEQAIADLVSEALDRGTFPELTLELTEEVEVDYTLDEDEQPELNFEETA